ncbi:IclR family transcriptional regulator [Pseudoclavibacter sp. 13-3]|uniref:IclR family transcriptional regulator n=1 Tax=Pseudoclavibacter sp. 13-3 TaxID=2901228 RepID=UPI001E324E4C|nr:IclR family transcriptional regulator [Pseudoclavibacter sp. 13-3]MCD7100764.1 IclR family transcriptional regulator [Pseudoclavibacter sp. 13-3]
MTTSTPGSQTLERGIALLRLIATRPSQGMTTAELVGASALTRPTAHRLLTSLERLGMLERDESGRRWLLGPELYVLGTLSAQRVQVEARARPHLRRIADLTEESAFLSVRRGAFTVCLAREEGAFPIRSFVLQVGSRFPLGVASAGMAVIARLEDAEADEMLAASADEREAYGTAFDLDTVHEQMAETRRRGYALNPGKIVNGSYGIGAAVLSAQGRPEWALSVTGIEQRLSGERGAWIGDLLRQEAQALGQELRHELSAPAAEA